MFRLRPIFLSATLIILLDLHVVQAGSNDLFGASESSNDGGFGYLTLDRGPWDFSLSLGGSNVQSVNSTINSPQTHVRIEQNNAVYTLNFPARTFSADSFSNGYSLQFALTRQILSTWASAGLQGGLSLGHSHQAERGAIPFVFFDQFGNVTSSQDVNYYVDYKLLFYHIEPILKIGPWIPAGHHAWKPYVSIGGGLNQSIETAVMTAAGANFELARRTSTSFGVIIGGGLDFRLWSSGAIGVQYQYQRIFANNHDWTLGLPTIRLAYLF